MPDYIVLTQCEDGQLKAPQVHHDCADAAEAVERSTGDQTTPCRLIVSAWAPESWTVRHQVVAEPEDEGAEGG